MKKILLLFTVVIAFTFTTGFSYNKVIAPNHYYKVYLNDEVLGVITSKDKLEKYIDENGNYYKKKYNVSKIYAPEGLYIEKLTTYKGATISIKDVYKKIKKKGAFTVKGYEFTISKTTQDENNEETTTKTKINVLKKSTFKDAVNTLIKTYVGEDAYQAYKNDSQSEIDTTGEIIENVYVNENITVKETNISVDDTIYTDSTELSKYLLYGEDYEATTYTVKAGDTIETVAFNNEISPEELLLSNDSLNSETNLLYPSQELLIASTNPLISIVEEKYVVEDTESNYSTEEQYDDTMILGDEEVIQEGSNGLDRVSQNVKIINGEIVYVELVDKQVIKSATNKIVKKGSKQVPTVGSLTNWGWPTTSGWTLSSGYIYRSNPLSGKRELHSGLDIAGTGYGSPVYATNNGVVKTASYHYSYGNHVVINHNNGYLTLYAHMSKIAVKVGQTIEKGQIIGYVGMTGSATGPHVHYEVWKGCDYCHVNPSVLYPNGYR